MREVNEALHWAMNARLETQHRLNLHIRSDFANRQPTSFILSPKTLLNAVSGRLRIVQAQGEPDE